jgi:polyphenol oxidase
MSPNLPFLVPNWPAPAKVRATMSTRAGGVSVAPWHSLNLGDHVGDAPEAVAENRQRLQSALQADTVFLRQVHGTRVQDLTKLRVCELSQVSISNAPQTPQASSNQSNIKTGRGLPAIEADTIMVADCLPVLFCRTDGSAVAAAHAGWRGLCEGVLENTLHTLDALDALASVDDLGLREHVAAKASQVPILAWLGPCIGPTVFEVGAEVRAAFVAAHSADAQHFAALPQPGKYLANLPALARARLRRAGVPAQHIYGNDGSPAWCTVGNADQYFSHRRDGVSGRMAACVWRV